MLLPRVEGLRDRFELIHTQLQNLLCCTFSSPSATQKGITARGALELPRALFERDQGGQSLPSLTHDACLA